MVLKGCSSECKTGKLLLAYDDESDGSKNKEVHEVNCCEDHKCNRSSQLFYFFNTIVSCLSVFVFYVQVF
jgi:hypothetical protein